MFPYWLLFGLAVGGVVFFGQRRGSLERIAWVAVLMTFALIIGLRDHVGCDWGQYWWAFTRMSRASFKTALTSTDPGYHLLNWTVAEAGGDIYWVNSICGILTMIGVGVFCRRQPSPWLALAVSVPYYIIVVAMGYTRQSVALAFSLLGLTYLGSRRNVGFVLSVLAGATFHKSAVLLLPIAALAASRSRLWTWLWVGITTGVGAQLLLLEESEKLWNVYVERKMQSEGGQIRVAMNAVPAVLFLILRRRLTSETSERRLWWWFAVFALCSIPLVSLASTAVDRVALYFIPLQMFVFSRLGKIVRPGTNDAPMVAAVLAYYAAVQFVWLNFASHAHCWVPYWMVGLHFGK